MPQTISERTYSALKLQQLINEGVFIEEHPDLPQEYTYINFIYETLINNAELCIKNKNYKIVEYDGAIRFTGDLYDVGAFSHIDKYNIQRFVAKGNETSSYILEMMHDHLIENGVLFSSNYASNGSIKLWTDFMKIYPNYFYSLVGKDTEVPITHETQNDIVWGSSDTYIKVLL